MDTKLKADANRPTLLVETIYERKAYPWIVIGGLAALGGLILALIGLFDLKKLFDLGPGYLSRVLLLVAAVLLAAAGWLNVKAARAWREARSDQLSGASTAGAKGIQGEAVFDVGNKVRVKEQLTPQQKLAGPGWSPQMDHFVGRASVVKSINERGRIILEDFPRHLFVKEWLDLEE